MQPPSYSAHPPAPTKLFKATQCITRNVLRNAGRKRQVFNGEEMLKEGMVVIRKTKKRTALKTCHLSMFIGDFPFGKDHFSFLCFGEFCSVSHTLTHTRSLSSRAALQRKTRYDELAASRTRISRRNYLLTAASFLSSSCSFSW